MRSNDGGRKLKMLRKLDGNSVVQNIMEETIRQIRFPGMEWRQIKLLHKNLKIWSNYG